MSADQSAGSRSDTMSALEFTDPDLFVRSLCAGFDEVLALAPDPASPTTAR